MFTHSGIVVISASLVACLVTMIGILVTNKYEEWGSKNVVYFMSFAAGVMIFVSFLHVIPKTFAMNKEAPVFLLVGFFALCLTNRFLTTYICQEYDCASYSLGLIPMLGIGVHSFLDGIIYSVAFKVSVFTGILTTTETMLVKGVNDSEDHIKEVADFLVRLMPAISCLAIPTRPPAEEWVQPPVGELSTVTLTLMDDKKRQNFMAKEKLY